MFGMHSSLPAGVRDVVWSPRIVVDVSLPDVAECVDIAGELATDDVYGLVAN